MYGRYICYENHRIMALTLSVFSIYLSFSVYVVALGDINV